MPGGGADAEASSLPASAGGAGARASRPDSDCGIVVDGLAGVWGGVHRGSVRSRRRTERGVGGGQPTASSTRHIPGAAAARHTPCDARGRCGRIDTCPYQMTSLDPAIAARLRRDADGLVAAVVQQHDTGEVLMLAWMDDEALHRTLTTGRATYWSRSRREYWVKGETSGHHQYVRVGRARLRRRRAAGQRRPGRRRLPHRQPHLLLRRRAARCEAP